MSASWFDPDHRDFQRDPYPALARLRREAPVFFHEPWEKWILTRHADIDRVLRDRRFGRQRPEELGTASPPDCPHFDAAQSGSLMEIDPPEHTRIRRSLQSAFTQRHVQALAAGVEAHAHSLVDALLQRADRRADLLQDFAQPIPVRVIANLLGIPTALRPQLVPWSKAIIALFEPLPTAAAARSGNLAAAEFAACIEDCLEHKLSHPGDDLLTRLGELHREDPERLTKTEIVSNAILLLNAGHEAVVNVIGNGLHALLARAEPLRNLQSGQVGWETAVDELLRFDTPVPLFDRYVFEDVDLEGVLLRKNQVVALHLGAGNRDPQAFREPDRLDLERAPNPHLSFGRGSHFCLGAPLARVELAAALPVLLARLPELQLDPDSPGRHQPGAVFRVLDRLPVSY